MSYRTLRAGRRAGPGPSEAPQLLPWAPPIPLPSRSLYPFLSVDFFYTFPSPSPSPCPASSPRWSGFAASRPGRPRSPTQGDSQGQPFLSPFLPSRPLPGLCLRSPPARPWPAAALVRTMGGRALQGSGQCRPVGNAGFNVACSAAPAEDVDVWLGTFWESPGELHLFSA